MIRSLPQAGRHLARKGSTSSKRFIGEPTLYAGAPPRGYPSRGKLLRALWRVVRHLFLKQGNTFILTTLADGLQGVH